MAKGNMLLGLSRGKLGDLVFYRANGKQVSRVRVREIKNPKSDAQKLQRMVLATVGTASSKLKSIVNHSFEGVQYGAQSLAKFRSLNMKLLRAAAVNEFSGDGIQTANFNIRGFNYIVPNAYVVSRGSLNVNPYEIGKAQSARGNGIFLQTSISITEANNLETYAEFLGVFGFAPGDQLTLVEMRSLFGGQSVEYGDAVNTPIYVAKGRIVFKKEYTNTGDYVIEQGNGFVFNPEIIDIQRSSPSLFHNQLHIYPTYMVDGSNAIQLSCPSDELFTLNAGAIIRSAEDGNGSWFRSNSSMVFDGITAAAADVYTSYGDSSTDNIGSDYYLNNALTTSTGGVEPVTPASGLSNVEVRGTSAETTLGTVTANTVQLLANVGGASEDLSYDYTISFQSNKEITNAVSTGTATAVTQLTVINGTYYLTASVASETTSNTFVVQLKYADGTVASTVTVEYQL